MKLDKLFIELELLGIPRERYYLNGIYGSQTDTNTLSLVKLSNNCFEIYYKSKNNKETISSFTNEEEACEFLYKKLKQDWIIENIGEINGLAGMTFNERLYASGLEFEYNKSKRENPQRAEQILRLLDLH